MQQQHAKHVLGAWHWHGLGLKSWKFGPWSWRTRRQQEKAKKLHSNIDWEFKFANTYNTSGGHKFSNFFKLQYNFNFRSMKIAGQTRALFFL